LQPLPLLKIGTEMLAHKHAESWIFQQYQLKVSLENEWKHNEQE
jgi:hypothetical protein